MLIAYLLNAGIELWGKKWRQPIMYILRDKPLRFSELKRQLPDCSVKMLSEALDSMERDGIIIRTQYNTIPVKVTYELTDDVHLMMDNLTEYTVLLTSFFHKNKDKHDLPEHIVHLLDQVVVSTK